MGRSIGLPTLGSKLLWCKYAGAIQGASLNNGFNTFKQMHCNSCKFHKPRSKNWNCNAGWVEEQANDPEFKKVIKNVLSSE